MPTSLPYPLYLHSVGTANKTLSVVLLNAVVSRPSRSKKPINASFAPPITV